MKQTHINTLINSLGCWYVDDSEAMEDPRGLIEYAAKVGYAIDNQLCIISVRNFLETKEINPNSTFYKSWEDIVEKNRLELFLDQIAHYASTYGTNFEGVAYIPNENPLQIDYHTFTVIKCITIDELLKKVMTLLQGIALAEDLVEACTEFLYELIGKGYDINLEKILCKEVKYALYTRLKCLPKSTEGIRCYINYLLVRTPMIIQSRRDLAKLRESMAYHYHEYHEDVKEELLAIFAQFDEDTILALSKEFLRFRKWWLAVKYALHNELSSAIINKMRKLAKTHHVPFVGGFWEDLTKHSEKYIQQHIEKELQKLDNPFKIIKLLEMIKLRKIQSQSKSMRVFKIRNGKAFAKESSVYYDKYLDDVSKILLARLVMFLAKHRERLVEKGLYKHLHPSIKFPKDLVPVFPSSMKTFVGNLPFGSYYYLAEEDAFIGIYWRNEWGTRDFDLSLIDINGNKIGWDAGYADDEVTFSGDMTNADPEATEVLSIKRKCPQSTILINRYYGDPGSKYQLFFGKEKVNVLHKNYMVDPNNIQLLLDLVSTTRQQILGYTERGRVYFMNFSGEDSMVSESNPKKVEAWRDQCYAHIPLRETLLCAGYREWSPEDKEDPDIDLSVVTKDGILNFLV